MFVGVWDMDRKFLNQHNKEVMKIDKKYFLWVFNPSSFYTPKLIMLYDSFKRTCEI